MMRFQNRCRNACAVLVAGLLLVSGCSLRLRAHHADLAAPAPKPAAKPATKAAPSERAAARERKPAKVAHSELTEAREQSALAPVEPYWPYREGQLLLDADSLALAETALRSALARDSSYAPALSMLSQLYWKTGRHLEAVRLLEPVRTRPETFPEPMRAVLQADLALHYDALGRPDLANAAVAGSAGDARQAASARVFVTLKGDHPEQAEASAKAAVGDDGSAVNQNNFGITRLRAGDPLGARKAFLKAIDRDPALPGPYYNLAILEKFYLFDDGEARRWFTAYSSRAHDDPDSLAPLFRDPVAGDPPKGGDR